MSEEIKAILEEIRFKAGIYRDHKRRGLSFNDEEKNCALLLDYIQQKENIIKEVREWAKKYSCQFTNDDGELVVSEISFNIQARPCDLFKILEKVGDEK